MGTVAVIMGNIFIVLVSIIYALLWLPKHNQIRKGFLISLGGISVYLLHIVYLIKWEGCAASVNNGIWAFIKEVDACIEPFGFFPIFGQVAILAGVIVIMLSLAEKRL